MTRTAARVILTQAISTVLVTLTPLAAIRHPSSKHGRLTPYALRVKAATNAVLRIPIRRISYVNAYQQMNAVRATPKKQILSGVNATHLKIVVKVIHTLTTNAVNATQMFIVA